MPLGHYITYFVSLFVITNPFGNLPIFISLTNGYDAKRTRHTAYCCVLASFIIMMLAEWGGKPILQFFGISIAAFTIAGGFIIFMIGYSMLNSKLSPVQHTKKEHEIAEQKTGSIAVVPMALPLIAGPGTIATIILNTRNVHLLSVQFGECIVIVLVLLIILTVLLLAHIIGKLLGEAGVRIVTRIMGLILMAIAMVMMTHGIGKTFPGLMGHISFSRPPES